MKQYFKQQIELRKRVLNQNEEDMVLCIMYLDEDEAGRKSLKASWNTIEEIEKMSGTFKHYSTRLIPVFEQLTNFVAAPFNDSAHDEHKLIVNLSSWDAN